MFNGKPIIGVAGGIGSGKSFVARLFGEMGCVVIHSDDLVHQAYADPQVRQTVRQWWGEGVILPDGKVDRRAIGRIVFADPAQRERLEGLLHPIVDRIRQAQMTAASAGTLAFVWDSPLLFETGLNKRCDAVVFVEADPAVRLVRVAGRGWDANELARREKNQWPLDKKRALADYALDNTADAAQTRDHVSRLLSRILSTNAKETAR
ncbi:MAG TPA: dephospho-CoA kinase [Tepidisphaeraceae bacterium]|nr:dephospho-CoA kinase [Tepidisphaeraceae bacterium]